MKISIMHPRRPPLLGALTLAVGATTLAACASTPLAPVAALQSAQQAITTAEQGDGPRYSATELVEARAKLAAANAAVSRKEMVQAERLAIESRTEAELAAARTGNAKALAVNADTSRGTDTLIQEMQRKPGGQP
jgi:ABC-type cobalamin transport system ATPase subunit